MSVQAVRETFDEAARERIRSALHRYMTAHKIGVPRLRTRIQDADELYRELPLSTLQRFLRGSHRTVDLYVSMFAAFLKTVDAPLEPEDIGETLASFFSRPDAEMNEPETLTVGGMAGLYKTHVSPADAPVPLPLRAQDARGSSNVTLRTIPGQPFLVAQEDFDASRGQSDRRRFAYDGIALVRGGELHIVLRSGLTRRPKFYSLQARASGPQADAFILEGEGFEYPAAPGHFSHCKTQFVAQLEGLRT